MFDSSELTLDLVHILELIDNPENLSKVKSVVWYALYHKLIVWLHLIVSRPFS